MDSEQQCINEFFTQHRETEHKVFRNLTNGLKALTIHNGILRWKAMNKGRPIVVDVGCGRGGDLLKIARFNPKQYLGLDINSSELQNARERLATLSTSGRLNLGRCDFKEFDLRADAIPMEAASVDVVLLQLSLHFAFQTENSLVNIISELKRVLKPAGVAVGVVPDASRIAHLLLESRNELRSLGHFVISCEESALQEIRAQIPVGVAYSFSLHAGSCLEFLAPMKFLQEKLGDDVILEHSSAQHTICASSENIELVKRVLGDMQVSPLDWHSLAMFRTFNFSHRATSPE